MAMKFFAKRQLVTLFSAPNYCGEFDNAGGMMSVDETLMCSFQVSYRSIDLLTRAQGLDLNAHFGYYTCNAFTIFVIVFAQILKPSEKKAKYQYGGLNSGRPVTPPRGPVKKK